MHSSNSSDFSTIKVLCYTVSMQLVQRSTFNRNVLVLPFSPLSPLSPCSPISPFAPDDPGQITLKYFRGYMTLESLKYFYLQCVSLTIHNTVVANNYTYIASYHITLLICPLTSLRKSQVNQACMLICWLEIIIHFYRDSLAMRDYFLD